MKTQFFSPVRMLILMSFCIVSFLMPSLAGAGEVVLQDDKLLVAFDSDSGALVRMENKTTHWVIEWRPELGASFEVNMLLPNHKGDPILGQKQQGAEVQKISDHEVQLRWKDLVDERGETLPVVFTANATLTNGVLTFDAKLENNSSLMVESVKYPFFGDLNNAPDGAPLMSRHMWYGDLKSQEISRSPMVQTKQSLFCLIQSPQEGLYVEMQDPTQPYLIDFMFRPSGSAKSSKSPYHIDFFARHFIYVHPHSTATLAPVVMQCYQGDWHAGVDLYKKWRATWFKEANIPDWIKKVNSWQQLQINSPVQDYRVPYTNLISYAKQCADNGVDAIQLVGWNDGGQDGGDPAQNTDPGLGTWQQLHDFIARSQGMGVKIILFAKLNWADLTTAWYTNELYQYECTDPFGKRYEQGGYRYYTPEQLAGYGVHRRAVMDFQDQRYRNVATKEFKKILALGASGWLWDEVCHHASVLYSWAPGHGYNPPGYIYGGDMPLDRQLWAAADQVNTNFLFSGEGPEDWLMQYFPCSYFRVNGDSVPVCRYIDSQAPLVVAVTGFDDREKLNLCLLDRYIIEYEPYNFKGHLEDFPLTLDYGKKIDALRRKYADYLWYAKFHDTLGANVTASGDYKYSVFETKTDKRAVVIINMEFSKPITANVKLPHAGELLLATPEHPDEIPTSGTLTIPARSAAVILEQ